MKKMSTRHSGQSQNEEEDRITVHRPYFERMLKLGGRCAVIVPDGVTFGSSNAHKELRKMLVEENQLEAIIKLPSGVFKLTPSQYRDLVVYQRWPN